VVRITHVLLSLELGGLERGAVNVIRASSRRFGHAVLCLRRLGPREGDLPPDVERRALGILSGTRPGSVLRLRHELRASRPDLVRCYNQEALLHAVPAAAFSGVPIIYYNGGRTLPEHSRRLSIERWLCRFVSRVVVPSGDLADYMIRVVGVRPRLVRVVENGVDPTRFHTGRLSPGERESLGLPPEGRLLGSIGRLAPQKDYPTLLRAFAQVARRVADVRLVLVGDGPERMRLEALTRDLGLADRVVFYGTTTEAAPIYRALEAFALTSRWEGLSNVVLEAMASGVPVVTTRVEGTMRVLTDGEDGLVVEVGDADGVADRLLRVIENPDLAGRLREAGLARVRRDFSLQRMAKEYEALYDDVLAESVRRSA
jgi:glycosyltransferase involved in cell wall biosynthesis